MPASSSARSDAPVRRRVGRPPKLTVEAIVEAAHDVGFENLTMKAVADHLGVSVPGLYHYVRGKDDLLRLAAEFSAGRVRLPEDHGQHWAVWLYEWAVYNRDAFIERPGMLKQFIDGATPDRTGERLDTALGTLVRQGFTISEARLVYGLISEFAIGAAVAAIREAQAAAGGRPTLAEVDRLLATRDSDDLPHLRAMLAEATLNPSPTFEDGLLILLRGIVATRGERWPPIEAKLDAVRAGRPVRRRPS